MFSCIMPVRLAKVSYRELNWLREAVASVSRQQGEHELVIIDDASVVPISTLKQAIGECSHNIRFFRLENNVGLIRALNFGLSKASGEFICRLDADDLWLSDEKTIVQHRRMSEDDTTSMVFSSMEVAGGDGRLELHSRSFTHGETVNFAANQYCPIPHGSVMMRAKALRAIGGYQYRPDTIHVEDFATWEVFCRFFEVTGMPEAFLRYRQHSGSVSSQNAKVQSSNSAGIQQRFARHISWQDQRQAIYDIAEQLGCGFIDAGCWLAERWQIGGVIPIKPGSLKRLQGLYFDRILMPTANPEEFLVEIW